MPKCAGVSMHSTPILLFWPKITIYLRANYLFSAFSVGDWGFLGPSNFLTAISGEGRSADGMFSSRHLLEIS
jgi:hypothetical protein